VRPTRWQKKRTVAMQDLLAYPLLSVHIAESDQALAKRNLGLPPGADWPPTLFCDDIHALHRLALESDGVLFAPDAAVDADCRNGTLVKLKPRDRRQGNAAKVSVITLANRSLSPAAAMLIERLKSLEAEGTAPGNRR
jgi:DNA-binding transcriptional LysR family regulator